ncbi:MAG: hypothetical protein IAG13_00225 [Deltaproteobacteria bacterium]|nr:hypothetical protein [Nannocystaceae bacterium]
MTKQLRLTMIAPNVASTSALVTLLRSSEWSARAVVEHDGRWIEHTTIGHPQERAALLAIVEWLRERFGPRTTRLGGTVTITGVAPAAAPPTSA